MPEVHHVTSRVVPLLADHVDTDQIIPARFLKGTSTDGLADALFADWRRAADFVLNRADAQGAAILLAGENFGCGSSREHAPWALVAWGFRAVIARSFADIFRANALKNGLLPVAPDAATHAWLAARRAADPGLEVTIDLEALQLRARSGGETREAAFVVDPFARHCLLHGIDELGYLLSHEEAIRAHEAEAARPPS